EELAIPHKIREKLNDRDNTKKMIDNVESYPGLDAQENWIEEMKESKKVYGRVSPWCKEEIYRLYLEGWTIRDLSYKYGLLPERVKVIIFMRDQFWKVMYPKLGESGLRQRL